MSKVLIIEDDQDIIDLLSIHINDLGFEVEYVKEGPKGLETAINNSFDLIVLDVMLPGKDGLQICSELRMSGNMTPILMLTARSEEIDKVLGLEVGADDYLTKPFSVREFIARIKALLRRTNYNNAIKVKPQLKFENLLIDIEKRKVTIGNSKIDLTPKEFELLVLLAQNPGKSYDRASLLSLVWGYDFKGYEHTVNSHVNRLRSKIENDPNDPIYIKTVWGVGYTFNDEL